MTLAGLVVRATTVSESVAFVPIIGLMILKPFLALS